MLYLYFFVIALGIAEVTHFQSYREVGAINDIFLLSTYCYNSIMLVMRVIVLTTILLEPCLMKYNFDHRFILHVTHFLQFVHYNHKIYAYYCCNADCQIDNRNNYFRVNISSATASLIHNHSDT